MSYILQHMKVLGIETSADDTGIALIEAEGEFGFGSPEPSAKAATDFRFEVLSNLVSSQTVHAQYGGIYPNLAKSEHAKNLPLLLQRISMSHFDNVDVIAVTVGPGLEPCLWEGVEFAKKLSAELNVPVVPVNHMEGHILVSLLRHEESEKRKAKSEKSAVRYSLFAIRFPAIALLISGGHTELVLMKAFGQYQYLGRTRDDAVGEAFDKVARMLDLPYPGGPAISALAQEARSQKREADFSLPRPMMHEDNYDFSFAGLKTAVLRFVEKNKPLTEELKTQVAREFEDAAADVLVAKTLRAAEEYGVETVIVGGGVSANAHIRLRLADALAKAGTKLLLCPLEFSGDNALMIALAGYFHALKNEFSEVKNLHANGTLKLC